MNELSEQARPVVAIVGRPNVGKSALFNRLVGEPISIVEDEPGVTRDRIYGECSWNRRTFTLVDTGGMIPGLTPERGGRRPRDVSGSATTSAPDVDHLRGAVLEHARVAVEESSVVVFLVDATTGLHPLEEDIADLLRRSGRPVLLVANKVDNNKRELDVHEFYALGVGEPWPVSATHGIGTGDLLDEIVLALPPERPEAEEVKGIRLAIVGRPNVGKSSLLNALTKEDRAIVDDVPGTTRDAVDTAIEVDGQRFVLVDTAGLRRRARIDDRVEYFSSLRSHRAIRQTDLALLVVDATEGVLAQDKRVAGFVSESSKAVIVVVNKWDLVRTADTDEETQQREYGRRLFEELSFMPWAPVLFVSALTGEGVDEIFALALEVYGEFTRHVDTASLNRVLKEATMMRPPPTFKGEQLKIQFAHQKDVRPPTFLLKVNSPKLLHFSYRRYLENHLRRAFGLMGTPIELVLQK